MSAQIRGILPIVHTPFNADDTIDWPALQAEIDWGLELGIDGYCAAMASELLRLTADERCRLTENLVAMNRGRGVVVASVGAESIQQALVFAEVAERAGCDGIMAIPPIHCGLPEAGLEQYYCRLADAVAMPLIIQDASGYVGQPMSVSFQASLLHRYGPDKILFKPEAHPIGPTISALRQATDGKARMFEGSGGVLLIDNYRRGIAGTMPGFDLLDGIVAAWRALTAGDDARAYALYYPICAIVTLQAEAGLDGFLTIEKHLLHRRGLFPNTRLRQPVTWQLDAETRAEVDRLYDQLQAVLA